MIIFALHLNQTFYNHWHCIMLVIIIFNIKKI